jgi:hypothetical protein
VQVQKSVEMSHEGELTTLWDQVKTDKTIPTNKLDIVIRDNEKGTRLLLHVEISGDRNMTKRKPKIF